MKKHSTLKKIIAAIIALIIYIQLGNIFYYYMKYAEYYPNSLAAKIIMPLPPFFDNYPFGANTPDVNYHYEQRYKNFDNYINSFSSNLSKYITIVFWPIILFMVWIGCLIMWIGWIGWQIILFIVWLWNGGIAKAFGLM